MWKSHYFLRSKVFIAKRRYSRCGVEKDIKYQDDDMNSIFPQKIYSIIYYVNVCRCLQQTLGAFLTVLDAEPQLTCNICTYLFLLHDLFRSFLCLWKPNVYFKNEKNCHRVSLLKIKQNYIRTEISYCDIGKKNHHIQEVRGCYKNINSPFTHLLVNTNWTHLYILCTVLSNWAT